jgi:hypothetical protein
MPDADTTPIGRLRLAFTLALAEGHAALARGDLATSYAAFERAHILGQPRTAWHVRSHLGFIRWAWRARDLREAWGQCVRLPAAALFTWWWVPVGNTGGARVSALEPMPIPAELKHLLDDLRS